MSVSRLFGILVILFLWPSQVVISEKGVNEYLKYTIPETAVRSRARFSPLQRCTVVVYKVPGEEKPVAIEYSKEGKLIKRELFLDGERYGIQIEWHSNGVKKRAFPHI